MYHTCFTQTSLINIVIMLIKYIPIEENIYIYYNVLSLLDKI